MVHSPRPILKRSSTDNHSSHSHSHPQPHPHYQQHMHAQYQPQHGVHFPPSPALTRTFTAYSATAYDRSPIVVTPNSCAMPERGCPGRTYFDESPSPTKRGICGASDYHPRALAFASASSSSSANYLGVPPLIPDLSSESEESDGFAGIPPHSTPSSSVTFGVHGLAKSSSPKTKSIGMVNMNTTIAYPSSSPPTGGIDPTLAFLPYPPSPPSSAPAASSSPNPYPYPYTEESKDKPARRRRGERERRHESSRDPDRIRSCPGGEREQTRSNPEQIIMGFSTLSLSVTPPTYHAGSPPSPSPSPRKKGSSGGCESRRRRAHEAQFAPSVVDDGCLGGF